MTRHQDPACPNADHHTPSPEGRVSWHEWAAKKSKTHRQLRCPGCGLYKIWIPNPGVLTCAGCGNSCDEIKGTTRACHREGLGDGTHDPGGRCIDCGRFTRDCAYAAWLCQGHTISVAK